MRILVLSDLHVGTKARTKDLCPYPERKDKDEKLVSSFFETISNYISQNESLDYVIIPGDITNQSNLIEFNCAQQFIMRLVTELPIPLEKIIFVPGNHDVDWSVLEGKTIYEEEKFFRKAHKYNTLNDKTHIFSDLSGTELTEAPFIKSWEFENIVFFGYNSSWHDDSLNPKHYGLIEKEHIDQLKEIVSRIDLENKLKIFIVHHHVYQYPNPHPTWIDISCLQNAQLLIEMLSELSFNFVIHGHRHVPNFLTVQINNFSNLNFFCAGSYSCEVHADIAGSVGNLFHIIEIDDLEKCKGRIISKAYHATEYKWVESKENFGIAHISPFGNELGYSDLLDQSSDIIVSLLPTTPIIPFTKLTELIPELNYTVNATRKKLIADLERKHALKASTFGDEDLIFIKK